MKNFTDKEIKKLPIQKGFIAFGFNSVERSLMVDWLIAAKQADLDEYDSGEGEVEERTNLTRQECEFYWNRIIVKVKGYKIDRSNLDMSERVDECPNCRREYRNLANHRGHCRGRDSFGIPNSETLKRIQLGV